MKAMIFAAGLGTRFKPWTDHHPKALAVVNGKSLLQRNVVYLQQAGIFDVIVNVHHFADQVRDAIVRNQGWGSPITVSDETSMLLETGGGLKKAAWYFGDEPFVVINADILTNLDLPSMIRSHLTGSPLATLAVTNRHTSRYFLFTADNRLTGWKNDKTGEVKGPVNHLTAVDKSLLHSKAFSGIHLIDPRIFSMIGRTGKFSIIDVYLDLCGRETIRGFDHSDSAFIDVGKPEAVSLAEALFP